MEKNTLLGGKIFVFIIRLKNIFLDTTKFWGTQKNWRALRPNARPWLRACDAMQMHVHKTLYFFCPIRLCWLNLNSQTFL